MAEKRAGGPFSAGIGGERGQTGGEITLNGRTARADDDHVRFHGAFLGQEPAGTEPGGMHRGSLDD